MRPPGDVVAVPLGWHIIIAVAVVLRSSSVKESCCLRNIDHDKNDELLDNIAELGQNTFNQKIYALFFNYFRK